MLNPIGYVTCLQGKYDAKMKDLGKTTLEFVIPEHGNVLVMAQATAFCSDEGSGNHSVGVQFTLYDETGTQRAQETGFVKLQSPGHGLVPMTYLTASGLTPQATAKLTIETSPQSYGDGSLDGDDYFSIAVVELEHSVQPGFEKA